MSHDRSVGRFIVYLIVNCNVFFLLWFSSVPVQIPVQTRRKKQRRVCEIVDPCSSSNNQGGGGGLLGLGLFNHVGGGNRRLFNTVTSILGGNDNNNNNDNANVNCGGGVRPSYTATSSLLK